MLPVQASRGDDEEQPYSARLAYKERD
jgi:hypothetical protein